MLARASDLKLEKEKKGDLMLIRLVSTEILSRRWEVRWLAAAAFVDLIHKLSTFLRYNKGSIGVRWGESWAGYDHGERTSRRIKSQFL